MRRGVIYARYSSDLQNDRSVDDQFALCRTFCARQEIAVVGEYADRAISGASLHGRRGIADLIECARAGGCEVVVVEALDRISRDMGDLGHLYKELTYAGIQILTVHEGVADQIQVGVRGLVGALFLTDLAHKVRRGAAGKIRSGQRAGGVAYGYRPVLGQPGHSTIYEPEAAVVRRIFEAYVAGKTPREIAGELNNDKVPTPRGAVWRATTLCGGVKRGDGVLQNEIYHGVIVWNRVGKRKDPRTGKRVSKPNARADWQRVDAPHLRIIDEDLWSQALEVRKKRTSHGKPEKQRRAKRLLSGLIKCGVCGSGMSASGHFRDRPRALCSRYTESKTCTNSRHIYLDTLEEAVLKALRHELRNPVILVEMAREYHAERRKLAASLVSARSTNERRLGEVRRSLNRLVEGVADGSLRAAAVGIKMEELEAEAMKLETALAARADAEVLTLHPAALNKYLALLDDLATSINNGIDMEAAELIRALLDRVVVQPRILGEPLDFEIQGKLVPLLGLQSGGNDGARRGLGSFALRY